MSPLSSVSGLASGIDFQSLTDAIIAQRRAPIRRLEGQIDGQKLRSEAYLSLESQLSSLRAATQPLENASGLVGNQVSLKGGGLDGPAFAASASPAAASGTHDVRVLEVAARERLGGGTFQERDEPLGLAGTFDLNGVQIEVEADDTLNRVIQRINEASTGESPAGVRASVVTVEEGAFKLVLTSEREGATGIELADPSGLLQDLGVLASEGEKAEILEAGADARIRVDGVEVTRSTNSIDDVLDGITLTLLRADPDAVAQMEVSQDVSGLREAIEGLVEAYNGVVKFARDQVASEADGRRPLSGDAILRSIRGSIQSAMLSIAPGDGGDSPSRLAELGISFQVDGTFSVDGAQLEARLLEDPHGVADLMSIRSSSSDPAIELRRAGRNTDPGEYEVVVTEAATRAMAEGAEVAPIVEGVEAGDLIRVQVPGVEGGTEVVLTEGMTLEAVADLLNDAMSQESLDAEAAVEDGRLVIRHQSYGSGSGFVLEVEGNASPLTGLSSGEYLGRDVAGMVNGQEASGTGRTLAVVGEGPAQGLVLRVTGIPEGGTGELTFERGIAAEVGVIAGAAVDGRESSLQAVRNRLEDASARLRNRAERIEDRLEAQREELNRRFAAVEQAIARAQDQGSSLSAQLTQISNFQRLPRR